MKIVIDARGLRGSTGRYHRQLLKYLQELDHDNHYVVLVNAEDEAAWSPTAANFARQTVPYKPFSFGEQLGLARALYRLKPDLVHFLMPQQPFLYIGRKITTIHDLTLLRFDNIKGNRLVYRIQKLIFACLIRHIAVTSRRILTPSEFTRQDVIRYTRVKPEKVITVYNGSEPLAVSKPKPIFALKGKQFVFYVGNAFPYKNLASLAAAVAELQQTMPDLHLVLAGNKEFFYERLAEQFKRHNYKQMHILGYVGDDQLAWLYKNTAAYVFPSLSEGFGLPGLEAMQQDCPLVSSNATCLQEIYGDAAEYFDPHDIHDMARAIKTVLENPKRREQLIAKGKLQRTIYPWQNLAEKVLETYRL